MAACAALFALALTSGLARLMEGDAAPQGGATPTAMPTSPLATGTAAQGVGREPWRSPVADVVTRPMVTSTGTVVIVPAHDRSLSKGSLERSSPPRGGEEH